MSEGRQWLGFGASAGLSLLLAADIKTSLLNKAWHSLAERHLGEELGDGANYVELALALVALRVAFWFISDSTNSGGGGGGGKRKRRLA